MKINWKYFLGFWVAIGVIGLIVFISMFTSFYINPIWVIVIMLVIASVVFSIEL